MTTKINSSSERTRLQIVLAAEKLFGENGIDAVSLRQVNVAAGQKNSSATHYHFGNKETLVAAIYEYRMKNVNNRRLEMLENSSNDVRSLIEAMVLPIAEEIDSSEGGSHYIRFLSQMVGSPSVDLNDLWNSKNGSGLNEILRRLQEVMPDMPMTILAQRFGLTTAQIFHSLADRERLRNNAAVNPGNFGALYVSNLIDCLTGSFSAPVSDTTNKELKDVQRDAS